MDFKKTLTSIGSKISEKTNSFIDNQKIKKAFEDNKNSINVQLKKGDRDTFKTINDVDNHSFYFLDEINKLYQGDYFIDENNQKYKVSRVLKNYDYQLDVDGENRTIQVFCVQYDFYVDCDSIFDYIKARQEINTTNNTTVNIENITNSTISDLVNSINNVNGYQTVNITKTWDRLRTDLDWRYDYKKYRQFINQVDRAIQNNNIDSFDRRESDRVRDWIGGVLGDFVGHFVASLIQTLNNK